MTAGKLATGALVAIALAVGVIVGLASPRQLSLGETATTGADTSEAPQSDARDEWLAVLAPEAVAGRLDGIQVAVLVADGAPSSALDELENALAAAGATESVRVALSADWWDPDLMTFRSELADQLRPSVTGASGAAPSALLQHAIVQALVAGATPDPPEDAADAVPTADASADEGGVTDLTGTEGQSRAAVLLDALTRSGMLAVDGGVSVGAEAPVSTAVDAVIIVAGSGPDGAGLLAEQAAEVWKRYVPASLVVIAADPAATTLPQLATEVSDAAADAAVGRAPSVVVTSEPSIATAQMVLALREQLDGGHGTYGAFEGLEALP